MEQCSFALTERNIVCKQPHIFSMEGKKQNRAAKQHSIFLSKLKLLCFILINDANEAWGLLQVCNSSFHYTTVFHYFLLSHPHDFKHSVVNNQLPHRVVLGTLYLENEQSKVNLPPMPILPIVSLTLKFTVADSSGKKRLSPFSHLPKPANVNQLLLISESVFGGQITATGLPENRKRWKNYHR